MEWGPKLQGWRSLNQLIHSQWLTSSFNLLFTHIHLNWRLFSSSLILMLSWKPEQVSQHLSETTLHNNKTTSWTTDHCFQSTFELFLPVPNRQLILLSISKTAILIRVHQNLSWEATAMRDHLSWRTTSFWWELLHFSVTEPVTKDHLSWETIF